MTAAPPIDPVSNGCPPGGRVKGGAVEVDGAPVGGLVDDGGGEIAEVGVGVVEAFGHAATAYSGRTAG